MSETTLPKNTKRRAKWVWILLILIAAGAGGGFYGWKYYQHQEKLAESKPVPPPMPVFMPLDTFTVNLISDGEDADRVLYIGLTLRLPDEATRTRMNDYLPEMRSRLLMLLSRQHAATLASEQGKTQLMTDIKAVLMPPIAPGQPKQIVSDVLFTAFILR